MELNVSQRAAVASPGHTMVISCPGSGKTRVLVEKARYVLERLPSSVVVLVTFTREAALELKKRLSSCSGGDRRVRTSTFHSLALRQLMVSDRSRLVLSPSLQESLLRRAWSAGGEPGRFQTVVEAYEFMCVEGARVSSHYEELTEVLEIYLDLLSRHSAIDLPSAVNSVVEGMRAGSVASVSATHLFVDEFQDVDSQQLAWVLAHGRAGVQVSVVGDDDQSIYGFRRSLGVSAFTEFRQALDPSIVHLTTNYRCRPELLALGGRLVELNTQRLAKRLECARPAGGSAKVLPFWSQWDEAERIAERLARDPGRWAVIARSNYKLDPVEMALREAGVPVERPGRSDFWEHADVVLLVGLLSHGSPTHRVALSNALALAGVVDPESSLSRPLPSDREVVSTLLSAVGGPRGSSGANGTIAACSRWLSERVFADRPSPAMEAAARTLKSARGGLQQRLSSVDRRGGGKKRSGDAVSLLTMHGSKGLEFPAVWIPAVQAGVVPHNKAECVQEERRLMYVAMTRAMDQLVLSFSWNQVSADTGETTRVLAPSSFLSADLGVCLRRPEPA